MHISACLLQEGQGDDNERGWDDNERLAFSFSVETYGRQKDAVMDNNKSAFIRTQTQNP